MNSLLTALYDCLFNRDSSIHNLTLSLTFSKATEGIRTRSGMKGSLNAQESCLLTSLITLTPIDFFSMRLLLHGEKRRGVPRLNVYFYIDYMIAFR